MPIQTDKNTNYGPPLVSQKYSPLLNIQYAPGDNAYYSALLTNRWNLLNAANILPRNLRLATANWPTIIAAEAGHLPPLVVISSNRSNWIAAGIAAADTQLATMPGPPAAFANASDLNALTAQGGQTQSPPLYCPTRTGANRNVYIVVHILEYATYQAALAGTGITIIGWVFDTPNPLPAPGRLAGFGASRFAAIEFCKQLRAQAAAAAAGVAPWNYAWLLDDNVVALTSFPGYAAVEGAMTGAEVCAGLHGGTSAEAFLTNRNWARTEVGAGRGGAAAGLPASVPPGIVQQAALWNIAYLTANNLNFGPVYVTSGEDLSFGNYFNAQNIPYFYYNGIGVRKEDVGYHDGSAGAQRVTGARQGYAAWFAAAEAAGIAGVLPPPVQVQPTNAVADGGVQTLANFIVNRVLPNSPMAGGNAAVQNTAKCQGVEQITCGAISPDLANNPRTCYVAGAALTTTFQINGAAGAQPVSRVNLP